jgi:hypothetical protein
MATAPPALEVEQDRTSLTENGGAENFFTVGDAGECEEGKASPETADLFSQKERQAVTDLPYDPAQEKERLSAALSAVYKHWGTAQMAQAYLTLVQAIARAEHALAVVVPMQETQGRAFTVQVLGLDGMIQYAREELVRLERSAPALVGKKRAKLPSVR